MTEAKIRLDSKIGAMVVPSTPRRFIARRLFLYDFTNAFVGDPDRGFAILNEVSEHFGLPFSAIKVVGSAQTGYSYFSKGDFLPGVSDLDIAIISPTLFQHYSQEAYAITRGYSDLSRFHRRNGISVAQGFRDYLSTGFFRPDLMPASKLKNDWFGFFNKLSNKHTELFHDINAGIYLSEGFFEMKNASIIDAHGRAQS
jgi:hypothetical protein